MPRTRKKLKNLDELPTDLVGVHGFARLHFKDAKTGEILHDTKWNENVITAKGFGSYIVGAVGALANSSAIAYIAIATQTAAPASSDTALTGEQTRKSGTKTLVGTGTLQSTASWATNEANTTLGTIALYATDSGGSMACATTFTSSVKTTDQTLSATYSLTFS
jgi:hypothetical protein